LVEYLYLDDTKESKGLDEVTRMGPAQFEVWEGVKEKTPLLVFFSLHSKALASLSSLLPRPAPAVTPKSCKPLSGSISVYDIHMKSQ